MEQKEFHIWHFPEDKVRILLKNQKEFFDDVIGFFGSQKATAKYLEITPELLSMWKRNFLYIPLYNIKKIINKLNLDWIDIEKNVISYKGASVGIAIKKPKIPIKESPEIFELITHIICDGSVNKIGIPYYTNSNKGLINNFQNILQKIFGKVRGKLNLIKRNNSLYYQYRFPKIIGDLLSHFYNIDFYNFKNLPKRILYLPKEFTISVIRAFADDEGSVDLNRRIGIYSTNMKLLETLIKLLKERLHYKHISDIKIKDKAYYYFYIKTADIEKYQKEIGFVHLEKRKRLKEIISIRNIGYKSGQHGKFGETKEKILKLLNGKILSTYDIMKEIRINKSNINIPIKKLINRRLIVQDHKEGQTVFWTRRK